MWVTQGRAVSKPQGPMDFSDVFSVAEERFDLNHIINALFPLCRSIQGFQGCTRDEISHCKIKELGPVDFNRKSLAPEHKPLLFE